MHDPRVVANYILEQAWKRQIVLSNLALQKLLYFAHAISLVERKHPLVQGTFEAWKYGPVLPAVYQSFKEYGSAPIITLAEGLNPITRARKTLPTLEDQEAKDVCDRVVMMFGNISPGRLVDLTHAKDGPWDAVISAAENSANLGLRIDDEVIVERFGRHKISIGSIPKSGEPNEDTPYF